MEQFPHITDIVITVDQDLQLETDFRLSQKQRIQLAVNHEVTLSYLTFKPFAKKAHQYLAMTSEDDRFWTCTQDLVTYDYTIRLLPDPITR